MSRDGDIISPKTLPLFKPFSEKRSRFITVAIIGMCFSLGAFIKYQKFYHDESLKTEKLFDSEVNEIEYDSNGNELRLVKGDELAKLLRSPNHHLEVTDTEKNRKLWYNDLIPYHFWTAGYSRGYDWGWGTAPGNSFIVLKSWKGRYVSLDSWDGNYARANRGANGPWEKFQVSFLGDNTVALKGWNGKYMCCDNGDKIQINRGKLGPWEEFYLYTTSNKNYGLDEGDDYLALKSKAFNKWVVVEDNEYVRCDRNHPGPWEKFYGWTSPTPWNIDSVQFDLSDGLIQGQMPVVLGRIVNDNRDGSIERIVTKTLTKTIAQTESYSNTASVGIKIGTSFKTGVPFISGGKISTEISASYSHTWGTQTYTETTYTNEIVCRSPPGVKTICSYVANKAHLDVPYTMQLSKPGAYTKTISGTWYGVSTFEDHISFEEISGENEELLKVALDNIMVSLTTANKENINEIEKEITHVLGSLETMTDDGEDLTGVEKDFVNVQKSFSEKKNEIFS